jgi:hypothetical protein
VANVELCCLSREGLTVGIHKKIRRRNDLTHDAAVPTFSMPPDPALAQVIVDAWVDANFTYTKPDGSTEVLKLGTAVLERKGGSPTDKAFDVATQKIRQALKVDLKRAVIITEDEHDSDYYLDADEVVFVLPDPDRLKPPPNASTATNLLATAKLLMACTPNGI